MLFSSISFLYYFLPILIIIYFIIPTKYKNLFLLFFSLIFYFYGEPIYILILLLSCLVNYFLALLIDKYRNKSKIILILSLIFNVGLLFYFKYTDFLLENINNIFNSNIKLLKLALPLGISFFTFQTTSYVIDVYNKKVLPEKNIINFATYVCLFPQLVAGPIVRYSTISKELVKRKHSYDMFSSGAERFIIGLGKKVLIANVIGELASILLGLTTRTVLSFWMEAICFTLQIYYDFSGYSDMAIGLGRMFGFNFLENFNYPLVAKSITDFWRRWHISLSSWFRDYIYIPLGGNRVNKLKWIRNIIIVWFLTGLWHGASWNFIIWGLFFAIFLLIEKLFMGNFLEKHKIFGHFYTLFLVIISFVIFNCNSLKDISLYISSMFGFNNLAFINTETIYYLKSYFIIMIIAIIGVTPLVKNIFKNKKFLSFLEPIFYILLLTLITAYLIDSSFNPFLYFRF